MQKPFNRPVKVLKIDEQTEKYETWSVAPNHLHARVNTNYKRGVERLEAGAIQPKRSLIFEFRYSNQLSELAFSYELFALEYKGELFNIVSYDDYMEEHEVIRLYGDLV